MLQKMKGLLFLGLILMAIGVLIVPASLITKFVLITIIALLISGISSYGLLEAIEKRFQQHTNNDEHTQLPYD